MSIPKLTACWLTANQETNLALATFNIDFSLIKCEAPEEFKGIGAELSPARRESAEAGNQHFTARKVSALFQSLLPHVPHLIKAYGTRASEIAACRDVNPKPSASYGIFAEHAGIDGSSLWAAATSGAQAIPIHLLACFLARLWSQAEAISIWYELIEERKKELAAVVGTDPLYLLSQHLSRIDISRQQLAEWDASARAWLQGADDAMPHKQKQLMLILNNMALPVDTSPTLYRGVLTAWKRAMEVTNKLIQGCPQSIENGSVLLGLASWHIYPDLLVLHESPLTVKQHDPLIDPGGILTIGLQMGQGGSNGIYWSLPIGHMRYYTGPVMSERCLDVVKNRVTILQFIIVAIGAMTSSWCWADHELANFFIKLWEVVSNSSGPFAEGTPHWIGILAESMELYLGEDVLAKKQCEQLLRLGRKRCPQFVSPRLNLPPAFQLLDLATCLTLIPSWKDRFQLLQKYVTSLKKGTEKYFIIRIIDDTGARQRATESLGFLAEPASRTDAQPLRKRKRMNGSGPPLHAALIQWLQVYPGLPDNCSSKSTNVAHDDSELRRIEEGRVHIFDLPSNPSSLLWPDPPPGLNLPTITSEKVGSTTSMAGLDWVVGDCYEAALFISVDLPRGNEWAVRPLARHASLRLANDDNTGNSFGHAYQVTARPAQRRHETDEGHILSFPIFFEALQEGIVSPEKILNYFHRYPSTIAFGDEFLQAMRALATIKHIYKMLPDSTVDLGVTSLSISNMEWVKSAAVESSLPDSPFRILPMDTGRAFSCITLLESGTYSLDPSSLSQVMAMAVANSIYISAKLLCDPSEDPSECEV